jgi:hypothetical protein
MCRATPLDGSHKGVLPVGSTTKKKSGTVAFQTRYAIDIMDS